MYFDTCHEKSCFADDIRINDDDDDDADVDSLSLRRGLGKIPPVPKAHGGIEDA